MEEMLTMRRTIDEGTARELAVKASCDPRTIKKVLRGDPVRHISGVRAYQALVEAGFIIEKREKIL